MWLAYDTKTRLATSWYFEWKTDEIALACYHRVLGDQSPTVDVTSRSDQSAAFQGNAETSPALVSFATLSSQTLETAKH